MSFACRRGHSSETKCTELVNLKGAENGPDPCQDFDPSVPLTPFAVLGGRSNYCCAGNLLIRVIQYTAIHAPLSMFCYVHFCLTFDLCLDATAPTFVIRWKTVEKIARLSRTSHVGFVLLGASQSLMTNAVAPK